MAKKMLGLVLMTLVSKVSLGHDPNILKCWASKEQGHQTRVLLFYSSDGQLTVTFYDPWDIPPPYDSLSYSSRELESQEKDKRNYNLQKAKSPHPYTPFIGTLGVAEANEVASLYNRRALVRWLPVFESKNPESENSVWNY